MHPLVQAASRVWGVEPEFFAGGRPSPSLLTSRDIERLTRDYYARRPMPEGFALYERDGLTPAVAWRPAVDADGAEIDATPARPSISPDSDVADCVAQLVASTADLWDGSILALTNAEPVRFSSESFFAYRLTTGLLGEEALRGETRLRDRLMPTLEGYGDRRITAGGLQAMVAVARPSPYDDFAIPIQIRSSKVSDAHGLHGVVPMAYHQVSASGDARPRTSALREIHEELFGAPESEDEGFLEHAGIQSLSRRAHIECTGLTLNLVNGNYDFNLLVCVTEPGYWEQYARGWTEGWEAARIFWISTKDSGAFHRLLRESPWVPQSIVTLHEGWARLRSIAPGRFA